MRSNPCGARLPLGADLRYRRYACLHGVGHGLGAAFTRGLASGVEIVDGDASTPTQHCSCPNQALPLPLLRSPAPPLPPLPRPPLTLGSSPCAAACVVSPQPTHYFGFTMQVVTPAEFNPPSFPPAVEKQPAQPPIRTAWRVPPSVVAGGGASGRAGSQRVLIGGVASALAARPGRRLAALPLGRARLSHWRGARDALMSRPHPRPSRLPPRTGHAAALTRACARALFPLVPICSSLSPRSPEPGCELCCHS